MGTIIFKIQTLIGFFIFFALPVFGQTIQIVADDFPPYNYYSSDGIITGVGSDIVNALLDELGIDAEIKILPWARAYQIALDQENVIIFTIVRNPQREDLFKWVGIVSEITSCCFSLKNRDDIDINTLSDLKKYRIGAIRDDVRTQYLLSKGFENIQLVSNSNSIYDMIINDRIDLWLDDELTAYFTMRKNNSIPEQMFKKVYDFDIGASVGYIAFSNETKDKLVDQFREAYRNIIINGTYNRILKRYL